MNEFTYKHNLNHLIQSLNDGKESEKERENLIWKQNMERNASYTVNNYVIHTTC